MLSDFRRTASFYILVTEILYYDKIHHQNPLNLKNSEDSNFGDDVREMMASRKAEKVQFPMLDMLRKEQEEKKNTSTEKDGFSEVVQEDFQKDRSPTVRRALPRSEAGLDVRTVRLAIF